MVSRRELRDVGARDGAAHQGRLSVTAGGAEPRRTPLPGTLPPGGPPAGRALRVQAGSRGAVLTVSGVLHLRGLPGGAVRGRWGRGGAVGLGLPDQHGEGVVRVHHLQRLRTEKAVTPLPVFCHGELVRGSSGTARAHASGCGHTAGEPSRRWLPSASRAQRPLGPDCGHRARASRALSLKLRPSSENPILNRH